MINNIYKNFFYLIVIFFLFILILLTFDNNFRRLTLSYILNSYKVYMKVSIQHDLKKSNPDYSLINNKLKNYIRLSQKISSGQSRLLIGIYDAANHVQSSIIDDKKYGDLEEFFSKLTKIDPKLYEAKIWYAKSLYANNKIEESIKEIDKAIKLSPLDSEPYRLALKIFLNQNNMKKFNSYCQKFLQSEFGGKQKRYQFTKLEGFNLNDFAIRLKSRNYQNKNDYILRGINNGKFDFYELIPETPSNISSIEMIFTFNPGTILEIKNIKFFSKENFYTIEEKDIHILSKNVFFKNSEYQNQIIFTSNNNEIINLYFNKVFKNIDKIIFSMKFDKLNLTNKICK
jgi:hypothetical protein